VVSQTFRDRGRLMISELICLDVISALHGRTSVVTQTFDLDDTKPPESQTSEERNALSERDLVRPLLVKYDLADIDTAIRWLQLGEYISKTQWGLRGPWVHVLTEKGIEVAKRGHFPEAERKLFYLEEPHQIFLAHQFRSEDAALEASIRTELTQ